MTLGYYIQSAFRFLFVLGLAVGTASMIGVGFFAATGLPMMYVVPAAAAILGIVLDRNIPETKA